MYEDRKLNEIELPLLDRASIREKNKQAWGTNFLKKLQALYSDVDETEPEDNRIIYLDGKCYPEITAPNIIKNTKYNPYNFIPKVLYDEFKFFSNMFFLLICLSQFYEPLKVGAIFL